jgi:uncharacterized membrane protein
MALFQRISSYVLFSLHILLVFFLLFEEQLILPSWMIPLGRLHPLMLHLPVGFLVLAGILWVLRKEFQFEGFAKLLAFIFVLTALSAAVAALMGFFLSREEGYEGDLLAWHKYTGVALSFLCYALWAIFERSQYQKWVSPLLGSSLVGLLVAGHLGASLTHGEDFLFPFKDQPAEMAFTDESTVYEAAVVPILKAKCYQCHNEQKTKGELLMTTLAGLQKGGKNGPIWVAGDALNSHMIQRANLPLEDKKHMPPKGKPQLTLDEISILTTWINDGASIKQTVGQLAANHPIRNYLAASLSGAAEEVTYDFDPAKPKVLETLNTPFRVVYPIAAGSPALQADFFVRQAFQKEQLADLTEIKEQLIGLNMTNMPITDAELSVISQLARLEKLTLTNTDLTGEKIGELNKLTSLRSLSLSGTKVTPTHLSALAGHPSLRQLFVWNTTLSQNDLTALQKKLPKVKIELGYVPDEKETIRLNPPVLENESFVLTDTKPVTLKHPLKGAEIRYTLDGTEPDSVSSPVYKGPIKLTRYTTFKARAVKEGWYASEIVSYTFFKGTYRPTTASLLQNTNPKYPGEGGRTLIDFKKGEPNDFNNKAWLGYRENPFEAMFEFTKATPVRSVMLSTGRNIGGYIFPPTSVELWAGPSASQLKLIQRFTPTQPTGSERSRIEPIELTIKEGDYTHYKVVARPLKKLPPWHPGKGEPAWVFIDEVFFN